MLACEKADVQEMSWIPSFSHASIGKQSSQMLGIVCKCWPRTQDLQLKIQLLYQPTCVGKKSISILEFSRKQKARITDGVKPTHCKLRARSGDLSSACVTQRPFQVFRTGTLYLVTCKPLEDKNRVAPMACEQYIHHPTTKRTMSDEKKEEKKE